LGNEIIEFSAIIDRKVKESNDFKMYAVNPTNNQELLKYNKYGNVSINGDIQDLTLGMEYHIKVIENKYGYEVLNIKREKLTSYKHIVVFLSEVVTQLQAEVLLAYCPNIIDKIINNDLDDIDLSKTKGIKEKTFEVIKRKVIENYPLMDFIEEFKEYGIKLNMARKMYKEFVSIERMREKMLINPYDTLCLISGISFKTADKMILSVKNNKNLEVSLQRINACVKHCLSENENKGNTWISLSDLSNKCNELVPESIDFLIDALVDKDIYVDSINRRIAYKISHDTEVYIADIFKKLLESPKKLMIEYSKYFTVDGCNLSDEQQNVLKNFCNNNLSLLVGNAGSGKSFCTQSIIQLCDDNNLSYILMTPTGKSAMVLSMYTNRDAGTIHRKLEYNPSLGWGFNEENKLEVDVVIIDENGMTDIFLMKHLLEAIDIDNTRVLFVQDDAQLPSVSCGNCAYDMINSGIIPMTRLTKVFRYGEGGLLQVATKIRNGEEFVSNSCDEIMTLGLKGDYSLIPIDDDSMQDFIIGIYEKLLNSGNSPLDIMVLSAKNVHENGTIEINKALQERINPHQEGKSYVKFGDNVFRVGDIVIQGKNNYKALNDNYEVKTITNGDIGKIIQIDWSCVYIQYQKDVIVYAKDELDQIDLAYCISIHRSQGSGVKNVILSTPVSHKWNLNRNMMYVGATRAKEKLFHLSLPSTINYAITKSIEMNRNTFLMDLLVV
jgi:RecD/TraA family predicted helicase